MTEPAAAPVAVAGAGAPQHAFDFRRRRFANWFPLGLTYATLYMGRYNFNVAKSGIGTSFGFSKAQMGLVATAGFWTYAISVLFNGPIADKFGGRRAILIGGVGAAVLNLVIGLLFLTHATTGLLFTLSILYAVNMYFQSFGALSVVKVNSAWFHVRERGLLGGVFGAMISTGYLLAYGICGWILSTLSLPWVYIIPSAVIAVMVCVDALLVRDRPSEAGYSDFPTGDEEPEPAPPAPVFREPADGDAHPYRTDIAVPTAAPPITSTLRTVLAHPVIRILICAEFCTGIVRQGLLLYFPEFLMEVHDIKPGSDRFSIASTGITVGGIIGGLLCGYVSDAFFQSRRAPVAFVFYLGQIVALVLLGQASPTLAPFAIGFCCVWIFGVHGMLSGTASMDFGGKKGAATAAGLLDGVQYLGSGLTGFGLGALLDKYHWAIWPYAMIPASAVGAALMLPLWNAKPGKRAH